MAYDNQNLALISAGYATDKAQAYTYESTDTLATILASGYFDDEIDKLHVNDLIYITASDGNLLVYVTSVTTNVTVQDLTAVRYSVVALTSAQILAMRASPITLVSAPGAGFFLEFVSAVLILDYNSAAYAESADNMAVRYNNGSGVIASQAIEATGFIDQTADTLTNALPKVDVIGAATGVVNKALVLHNTGDGEYTTGNSPMRVKVSYRVHVTGL
jgi:hypothetical protein